jgi:hypothetical protein
LTTPREDLDAVKGRLAAEPSVRGPLLFLAACILLLMAFVLFPFAEPPLLRHPRHAFLQLADWELPSNAEVLKHTNTHGGMTNDGDFDLVVRMPPADLQALMRSSTHDWKDCPIDPDIVHQIWDMPEHNGTQYWGAKTFESDADWHRGHIVIVNPETGMVWIHEWKGP